MVVEDLEEEDPILRFGAARRDTDEFFFCKNFVLEKEENAWSERDVDEVNMMIVCVLCGFFFFFVSGGAFDFFFAALLADSDLDSLLTP